MLARGCGHLSLRIKTAPDYVVYGSRSQVIFPKLPLLCHGSATKENLGEYIRRGLRRDGGGKKDSHSPPDCDPSRKWVISGHRDLLRRSSDCDGACLSGFWGYRPSSPDVERADLFCSLAAGRDLPVWTTGGRASTVWGLLMVYRPSFGCDGGRPERVIRQSAGFEPV